MTVTFDLDANGILSVTAVDKVTGAKGAVTITSATGRNSREDVARMVADAAKFASQDAQLKAKADARRNLEDLIFDILDEDELIASTKKTEAAAEAEDWLKAEWDNLTPAMINERYRSLRSMS